MKLTFTFWLSKQKNHSFFGSVQPELTSTFWLHLNRPKGAVHHLLKLSSLPKQCPNQLLSTDCGPTVTQVLSNCQQTVGQLSTDCGPTVKQVIRRSQPPTPPRRTFHWPMLLLPPRRWMLQGNSSPPAPQTPGVGTEKTQSQLCHWLAVCISTTVHTPSL